MANHTNDLADTNVLSSKSLLRNGDDPNYLYLNGNNSEGSNLISLSDLRHLPSNRSTTAPTDSTRTRTGRVLELDVDPLLDTEMIPKPHPPIAHPELDDDEPESDNIPNTPQNHPGVDDGFFPSIDPRLGDDDPKRPIPPNPKPNNGDGNVPSVGRPSVSNFPYAPGFDPFEGTPQIIPDVNVYQHKKTLAQGMMDLALLSANANQLRYVLESYNRHPYYYFSLVFISLSLILQIAVGVGLILNSRYDVKKDDHICKADRINNFTILGIFLITIVNVFISSFGVADPPPIVNG